MTPPTPFVARWVLVLVLSAATFAEARRGWSLLRASTLLETVEERSKTLLARREFGPVHAAEHLRALDLARRLDPANVAIAIARGSQFLVTERAVEAEGAYRQALVLEKRAEVYLNLARALKLQRREAEALEALGLSFRLNPALATRVARPTLPPVAPAPAGPPQSVPGTPAVAPPVSGPAAR